MIIALDLKTEMPSPDFNHSFYADAVRGLLTTFSAVDSFTVLAGGATFSPILLPSTQESFANLTTDFLPALDFAPGSGGLAELIRRACEILKRSRREGDVERSTASAVTQSAIIVITDRDFEANFNDTSANLTSADVSVKIFINSVNVTSAGDIEREITCNSGGVWNNISQSDTEAVQRIISYYRVLARHVRVTSPIWSNYRHSSRDFIGTGSSLCQPTYREGSEGASSELLGVTCIDLPVEEVERLNPSGGMEVSSP